MTEDRGLALPASTARVVAGRGSGAGVAEDLLDVTQRETVVREQRGRGAAQGMRPLTR